jgi:hypothetical protein
MSTLTNQFRTQMGLRAASRRAFGATATQARFGRARITMHDHIYRKMMIGHNRGNSTPRLENGTASGTGSGWRRHPERLDVLRLCAARYARPESFSVTAES